MDDSLIRHVFQKVSDVSASVIGKSNFWLSKIFGWLFIFFLTTRVVFTDYSKHSYVMSVTLWIMMAQWVFLHTLYMSRADASSGNGTKATLNPQRSETWGMLRAVYVVLVFLTLPSDIREAVTQNTPREWLFLFEEMCFVLAIYLAACQPPPPHLRNSFWERFQTKRMVPTPT